VRNVSLEALKEIPWWGAFDLVVDTIGHWRLAGLMVWIEAKPGEWRIHRVAGTDPMDEHASYEIVDSFPLYVDATHVAVGKRSHAIRVLPILGDRDVVARPETTTIVIRGDSIDFFVSTPISASIETPDQFQLMEVPSYRPSDTWFGDKLDGELCYASKLKAYTHLSRVKFRAARAVTKITVRNLQKTNITLERLRIPAPNLSLYLDESNNFWTEDVVLTVGLDDVPSMRIVNGPPKDAVAPRIVVGPRVEGTNVFVRALSRFLS